MYFAKAVPSLNCKDYITERHGTIGRAAEAIQLLEHGEEARGPFALLQRRRMAEAFGLALGMSSLTPIASTMPLIFSPSLMWVG